MFDEIFKGVRGCISYLILSFIVSYYVVCTSENKFCLTLKRKVFALYSVSSIKTNLELTLFHRLSTSLIVNLPNCFCVIEKRN